MATFIGFATIDRVRKFTLIDVELVKRDLLNAFNIIQGELPGRPGYGTILWQYVFENQSPELTQLIINEVQRVVGLDPRIFLESVQVYPQSNGIRVELQVQIAPNTSAETLSILFDQRSNSAEFI